ncbi:MAG: hypothetical protein M3290_08755 [Actinomycetota bacterium]|nr:hypothetical protein [Actinomycetota bacterium]
MLSHCPRCGRSLQALRVLTYENVVMSSDGQRVISASELSESTWRVFCAAGHEIGGGEVISLMALDPPAEEAATDGETSADPVIQRAAPRSK